MQIMCLQQCHGFLGCSVEVLQLAFLSLGTQTSGLNILGCSVPCKMFNSTPDLSPIYASSPFSSKTLVVSPDLANIPEGQTCPWWRNTDTSSS